MVLRKDPHIYVIYFLCNMNVRSVIKLKPLKYNQELFNRSHTCKNCHNSLSSKNQNIPMQT